MISNYLNGYNYQIIWELKKKTKTNKMWKGEKNGKENTRVKRCILPFFLLFYFKPHFWPVSDRISPHWPHLVRLFSA